MDTSRYRILLGQRIKFLREEQGLSQRKFALMAGTNQSYLWEVESGTTNVGVDLLFRISEALDVPMRDLLDFC